MKRILSMRLALCVCGLSVFFTGCNQEGIGAGGAKEVTVYESTGVGEPETTTAAAREKGGPKDVDQALAGEIEELQEERFDGLTGRRAFYFPENHSELTEDLRAFEILGLVQNYLYYFYVTTDTDTGKEVRVVARNHISQDNRHDILYEHQAEKAEPTEDGQEVPAVSFYGQICDNSSGEYRISIYEDGNLSIMDLEGDVKFTRSSENIRFGSGTAYAGDNLLTLIDQIFGVGGSDPQYFDREITSVVTNGRYDFFVAVSLSKEDYTKEDENAGAQETEDYLLYYGYLPIGNGDDSQYLVRYNRNMDKQAQYWRSLAGGGNSERDPENDLQLAKKAYPDRYGAYEVGTGPKNKISNLGGLYMWKDKDKKRFARRTSGTYSVPSTEAASSMTREVSSLTDGQSLSGYFFSDAQKGYCPLVGGVKKNSRTKLYKTVTRSYVVTKGEGKDAVAELITDSVDILYAETVDFTDGTAIERLSLTDKRAGNYAVAGSVENGTYSLGLSTSKNECNIIRYDQFNREKLQRTVKFPKDGEDLGLYIFNSPSGKPYVMGMDTENSRVLINTSNNKWITLMTADLNPSGYKESREDQKLMEGMKKQPSAGDYDASSVNLYGNPDQYGQNNVLVWEEGENTKLLLSTFFNGIMMYEGKPANKVSGNVSSTGTLYRISEYPIYRSWRNGADRITAIGFDRTDTNYQYMDIGRARIYDFNVKELMKEAPSRQIPPPQEETEPETFSNELKVPEGMKQDWEAALEEREKAPKPTGSETLPSVEIYETEENIGKAWEEVQESRK